jgi:hypothetical protein
MFLIFTISRGCVDVVSLALAAAPKGRVREVMATVRAKNAAGVGYELPVSA